MPVQMRSLSRRKGRSRSGRTDMHRIPTTVWMDFTGVYADRRYTQEQKETGRPCTGRETYISCRDISGTNCYCDEDAVKKLAARMESCPVKGVHFIDSGNYHYISRLWLSFLKAPFQLLVFDNHTDMQPPAFGGLLSCGGWLADALNGVPCLEKVLLAGPDEKAYSEADPDGKARVCLLSREELAGARQENALSGLFRERCRGFSAGRPLYISIDKDVLSPAFARTGWSQGDMSLPELLSMLKLLEEQMKENRIPLLGVDVCGECDPDDTGGMRINREANRLLAEWAAGSVLWTQEGADYEE